MAIRAARGARVTTLTVSPGEVPVLTSQMDVIADSVAERDVSGLGPRNLTTAAASSLTIDVE